MYTEKCSELSMQGERMLGNDNVRRKNTQNRQCKGARMLGNGNVHRKMLEIVNVRRKNIRHRQCKGQECSGIHEKGREYARNRQYTQRGDLES